MYICQRHDNYSFGSLVKVSLVIPVFNEEESVELFINYVHRIFFKNEEYQIEFVFIDDGSVDKTLPKLISLQEEDSRIVIVELTRNFGKEAALTAGIFIATGDVIIPIDVDFQDPPEVIFKMLDEWKKGYEVVLGIRIDRSSDTLLKRKTASWFYRIINKMSRTKIPENVGDFRLMDRCVVEALKQLPETHRFMKGLFSWLGFRTTSVEYIRPERIAGTTTFNGLRLWALALEGITSFSLVPLKIWTYIGIICSGLSLFYALFILLKTLLFGTDVPGYASLIIAILFIGGLQLISTGIIGEYLGRTYMESKRRPIFLTRQIYKKEKN
ncbi:TPA: glycosyltransferase family 2 protein [Escherichia coli]|uniref:glycosyltransferase family 2 protein n=1 Tax=Kluyvera ascorbata TaxID=51288 RepID=UPI001B8F5F6D|nr:glycosyltransferase family 2 protein [Kluyvera ascorbata]MDZ4034073.1 glycosyltransferase family 2 protein [Kluyvera ascorbata]HBD0170418.1 glycosyltransferase family 2 protein [Escherichia coli]